MQRKGDINKYFIDNLKQLRWENNLTQKELAEKVGISKSSIGFYENGDRIPDINTLSALADFFNVSTDYLLGRTDVKSMDLDTRIISEKTGLSEDVLSKIICSINTDKPIYVETRDSDDESAFSISEYSRIDVANMMMSDSLFIPLIEKVGALFHVSTILKNVIDDLEKELDESDGIDYEKNVSILYLGSDAAKTTDRYDLCMFRCEKTFRMLLESLQGDLGIDDLDFRISHANEQKSVNIIKDMLNKMGFKAGDSDGNDQEEE